MYLNNPKKMSIKETRKY